jgi:hypothetical protein
MTRVKRRTLLLFFVNFVAFGARRGSLWRRAVWLRKLVINHTTFRLRP